MTTTLTPTQPPAAVPEALRLANWLQSRAESIEQVNAAKELRRLHALVTSAPAATQPVQPARVHVPTSLPNLSADAFQAHEQCRAVVHFAFAVAEVYAANAAIVANDARLANQIGEASAVTLEWLADLLNSTDAVSEEDEWVDPILEAAHKRWPITPAAPMSAQPVAWYASWGTLLPRQYERRRQYDPEALSDMRPAYAAVPAAPMSAQPSYADSTPNLHVGDSAFESWFSDYDPAGKGDKQRARDAYAAGMGDPLVTAAPAPTTEQAGKPATGWQWVKDPQFPGLSHKEACRQWKPHQKHGWQWTSKNEDRWWYLNGSPETGDEDWTYRRNPAGNELPALAAPGGEAPAEDARDAARYRWLREQGTMVDTSRHPHSWRCVALLADMGGDHADAAIDAAMAAQSQKGGA